MSNVGYKRIASIALGIVILVAVFSRDFPNISWSLSASVAIIILIGLALGPFLFFYTKNELKRIQTLSSKGFGSEKSEAQLRLFAAVVLLGLSMIGIIYIAFLDFQI